MLSLLFYRLTNCFVKDHIFPSSIYHAHFGILLKKGRDSTKVASYDLLRLLNSDQKIVAKVLTNLLSRHVGSSVHPDQTGFIPDRL